MNRNSAVSLVLTLVSVGQCGLFGFQEDGLSKERNRRLTSALYQEAKAAGGKLYKVIQANPANLYGDLPALTRASDEILLVHIVRSGGQLSPSGTHPIRTYHAQVIQCLKGNVANNIVWFSTLAGMVQFDSTTAAAASIGNFMAPADGGRYLLFLRYSRGQEDQLTPARRLAGDGVQGAFELNDEVIEPSYRGDALVRPYWHMAVPTFLGQVQGLVKSQKQP